MIMTSDDTDQLEDYEFRVPCENVWMCNRVATHVVWLDHHALDCPYTGFRCKKCLNYLIAQTEGACKMLSEGTGLRCGRCGAPFLSDTPSDHLRWSTI